jgi:hypothetical protein
MCDLTFPFCIQFVGSSKAYQEPANKLNLMSREGMPPMRRNLHRIVDLFGLGRKRLERLLTGR